jgi:hypothetical protein
MRLKIFLPLLGLVLITSAASVARAQDEEEAVRGSFLTTRVTSSSKSGNTSASAAISASANQAAGKTTTGKTSTGKTTTKSSGRSTTRTKSSTAKTSAGVGVSAKSAGTSTTTVEANAGVESYSPSNIGIGYTLYMRDPEGNAIRVDPTREFRAGDRIRLSIESNTDGYLYIFHTENNGEPQMLYPDTRLEQGDNRIEAHVPYEIPWNEPGVRITVRGDRRRGSGRK